MASDNGGYDYYEDEVRLELDMDDERLLKQDTPAGSPWPAIMNARQADVEVTRWDWRRARTMLGRIMRPCRQRLTMARPAKQNAHRPRRRRQGSVAAAA
jgi:hypothetical protein